jgi:hypothetical protein
MVDMANAMGIQPVITTYAVGDVEDDPMIDTPGGISERSGGGSSVESSGRSSVVDGTHFRHLSPQGR